MHRPRKFDARSASRNSRLGSKAIGVALATGLMGVMLVAGSLAAVLNGAAGPVVDQATGCLMDGKTPATTLELLDGSDAFNDLQRSQAIQAALEAAGNLPAYGRMMIVGMNANVPENPIIQFSHCVPEHVPNSSIAHGAVYERRDYQNRIETPMRSAIDEFVKAAHSTVSPIAETVSAVSRLDGFDSTVPNRTLLLVSDLLQNDILPVRIRKPKQRGTRAHGSAGYSQYSYLDLEESFRASMLAKRVGPDLRGVRVVIVYLEKAEAVMFQTAKHRSFWTRYLLAHGAKDVVFRNVVVSPFRGIDG